MLSASTAVVVKYSSRSRLRWGGGGGILTVGFVRLRITRTSSHLPETCFSVFSICTAVGLVLNVYAALTNSVPKSVAYRRSEPVERVDNTR